jgi:hypothetical protein
MAVMDDGKYNAYYICSIKCLSVVVSQHIMFSSRERILLLQVATHSSVKHHTHHADHPALGCIHPHN